MSLLKYTELGYDIDDLNLIDNSIFHFHSNLPVSKSSKFGDSVWNWNIEHNARLKMINEGRIKFDWDAATIGTEAFLNAEKQITQAFSRKLPPKIIEDLKRAFFLYIVFPNLAGYTRKTKNNERKATTIVGIINATVNFLSYLYIQNELPNGSSRIQTIEDIKVSDLRNAQKTYPYIFKDVRKGLFILTSEVVVKNYKCGQPQWNWKDIKNIFRKCDKPTENIKPLHSDLFTLLSNESREYIIEFLESLGETSKDKKKDEMIAQKDDFLFTEESFEYYVSQRRVIIEKNPTAVSNFLTVFRKKYGSTQKAYYYLTKVQTAAMVIILLYTGMRYSEAASIRKGCLVNRNGIYLIKSTLIKGQPTNLPIDYDEWIAIDIVQDAVKTLEQITRFTNNSFLLSNLLTRRKHWKECGISNGGLTDRLRAFLLVVDKDKIWESWGLSPHQFRHGLVWQLARAEVGIPYITRQLHHFYHKIAEASYKINQTTLVYGLQKDRLLNNATGLNAQNEASLEVMNALYGEGRKFAGGGAALHVKRTEGFFRGEGKEGKSREKYIENLTKSGVSPVRHGIGYCLRNHSNPSPDEVTPPCIGDFNCNPECQHCVIPESRKNDLIRNFINTKKNISAPEKSHLKKYYEEKLESFGLMLQQLGVNIDLL